MQSGVGKPEVKIAAIMVKNGSQFVSTAMSKGQIASVEYAPRPGYGLDVEVQEFTQLLLRVGPRRLAVPHRANFHQMVWVTRGKCRHVIDFEPTICSAGSCLLVRAGEVQAFDTSGAWQGWLVAFRPEALPDGGYLKPSAGDDDIFQSLPQRVDLTTQDWRACVSGITQMKRDAGKHSQRPQGHVLLRAGLLQLVVRLHACAPTTPEGRGHVDPRVLVRFRRFRSLVEKQLAQWHHTHEYAFALGCSEKTLGQAVQQATGVTAKRFLVQRLVLEAKRRLIHTHQAVGTIGLELGFDEATNFIKFFRRESGMTPRAFRQMYGGESPDHP